MKAIIYVLTEVIGQKIADIAKPEMKERSFKTPAKLMKTGIKNVCLQTDIILPINFFHLLPIYVIKKAATYVEALRMVTICPANVLGLVNQIGILEKGKEADIVLLNKH